MSAPMKMTPAEQAYADWLTNKIIPPRTTPITKDQAKNNIRVMRQIKKDVRNCSPSVLHLCTERTILYKQETGIDIFQEMRKDK